MFRVIVVDDEKIVRIAMQSMIPWEQHGFQIVGLAQDGKQALQLIKEKKPHLIITDLKMPNMDGIQLIEELNNINFKGKTLVLSNYDDYDLVREAMKKGAVDYLLKVTIKPKDLITIINDIGESLNKELEREEEKKNFEEEFKINKKIAKTSSISNYYKNYLSAEEIIKILNKYDISLFNKDTNMIYLRIDNYYKVYKEKIKDKSKMAISIINIVNEILFNYDYELIQLSNHKYAVIISIKNQENSLKNIALNIQKSISLYLNITVSLVISKKFKGLMQSKETFNICDECIRRSFYDGENLIIDEKNYVDFNSIGNKHLILANKLNENIKYVKLHENIKEIEKFIEQCKQNNMHPIEVKKSILFIIDWLEGYQLTEGNINVGEIEFIKKEIEKCDDVKELKELSNEVINKINKAYIINKTSNNRREIQTIIEFIENNMEKKITLTMLANIVNMNECYLSRLFKQETGKNLTYYINEIKMKKSAELLKQHDYMVKEISNKVGIPDQFYFNKVFKKFYGMSPSKYKEEYEKKLNKVNFQ